ncbi:unnamed protein product [Strongylus vulgaris]|uniref:Bestrophin homolog n=1 Tax=Strongylus vulgaris TaxID=40348 RepID=A0A3P7LA70_STRVU|nr:unnamed protein product [Strongylus vulgaris]
MSVQTQHSLTIRQILEEMTVTYNLDVSQTSIVSFLRLQFRWRGSIWKSVLKIKINIKNTAVE